MALRQSTRYHGVWALGVRWLRNKPLPVKAFAVLACVVLPLLPLLLEVSGLRLMQWRQQQATQTALVLFARLADLSAASQAVAAAQGDALPARLSAEVQAFEQWQVQSHQVVAEGQLTSEALVSSWPLVQQRRTAFLAERRSGDAVTAAQPSGPVDALRGYLDAQARARRDLLHIGIVPEAGSVEFRALASGVLAFIPDMVDHLAPLTAAGGRWASDGNHSPVVARQLAERLGAARGQLAAVQPAIDEVRRAKVIDNALLDESLRRIAAHTDLVSRLLDAPGAAVGELERSQQAVQVSSQALMQAALTAAQALAAEQHQVQLQRLYGLLGLSLASLLVGGYVLVCVYKVTAGGLRSLCGHLEQLGQGNMSIRPQGWGADEVGRALNALSAAAAQVSQLFEAVSQGVTAVSLASREVAEGNAGLSGRTGEIRQAIGDVAQRAGSFSQAMDRCAGQVGEAAVLVREMQGEAQRSRKAMRLLHQHMNGLRSKSRDIEKTIGLVENVAYQTKLLSINASVEAARAGAAGKGFAVVAQEVRALAQRSEDAAQRIRDIINASVREIEEGHLVADRANDAVASADQRIQAVHGLMNEIVALTQDGRLGSQAVLVITRQVEESAGGNAKLVSQLSDASLALRGQGDSLKRSVQHFIFA